MDTIDKKESDLNNQIDDINESLTESKLRLSELKRKLEAEETIAIGLKLSRDRVKELLRQHIASLPDTSEQKLRDNQVDKEFRDKFPLLLEKL